MYGDIQRYTQLRLYQSIIEADKIVVAHASIFRIDEDDDEILFALSNVEIIFEAHDFKNNFPLLVLSDKTVHEDFPIIVPDKQHLLFLKMLQWDNGLAKKMGIDDSPPIFVVCEGWQSSICLDFFNAKSLASQLLAKKYHTHKANELINVVKEMSLWKNPNLKREEKVEILLKRLTISDNTIYADNIPPLISHLGGKVLPRETKEVFKKRTKLPIWRGEMIQPLQG